MPHFARLLPGACAFALAVVSSVAAMAAPAMRYDKTAFSRALATGTPVVVHVCAGWSPLCQTQRPIVGALLKEPGMRSVQLLNADFDTDLEARRTLRVLHQGTLIVFKNGREVARSSGDTDRTAIAALLSGSEMARSSGDSGRMTPSLMASRAGGMPYEKEAFDRAVAAGGPVALHVSADGCPTCKAQKPVVDALLREPGMRTLRFFVADFDTEKALRRSLRVEQQSTFVIFKNGREVARSTAELDRDALARTFAKAL